VDNEFARTAVHNTVTVDHQDQMRRADRFLWVDWAQASGQCLFIEQSGVAPTGFAGEHDGYRRVGVTHRRAVQWLHGSGWIIVDDILHDISNDNDEPRDHDVRLHWLAPDLQFEVTDSPFQVCVSNRSKRRFSGVSFSSVPGSAAMVRAGKLFAKNVRRSSHTRTRACSVGSAHVW